MSQLSSYFLSIAGVSLSLETDRSFVEAKEFLPFLTEGECPDYRACFRLVAALPPIPDEVLHEDLCYRVHPNGRGGYLRSFFDAPRDLTP